MAQNDNVVFKTSTTATIDDLFSWNKSTGQITAKTDNIPIVPGTVYFTADGHIVHDLAQNNRLWMSKNAYSAIYAEDVAETNTDIANAIKYSIHYVEGPTTDTTAGTWTGTINGITELYDGLTIIYVPAVAGGSSTTTLNINGLGEKTCYYNNTSKITTHYSAGTPILLTYRNNCWRRADYNSNTTYSAMSVAEMRTGTASSERSIRADYLKTFLSTLGGTNLTLTHSNSAPYLQLNHDPSGITAGTYGNSSQQTPSYGGTFNIPYFTVDTQGHITNASVTTVKIPESDNTDYKVRQTPINSNDNNNYRILLSNSANDTSEDSISKKNANLIYNPTENKLSTGNIKLTGELDVTGNVYLRNQTTVDNLTARGLIVNGNSTFNNDINLAQGAVKWTSNSLPSVTSADYFLVIDAFANGGATKHITKANAIKSLISSSAIGSSTKPVYWTGSAFSAITSYSGAAALTGTPTAPTAAAGTSTTQIATTEFVTNAVAQGFVANDAMVFKGLIGSNQLITQLPTSGYNAGWTYRVANAGIFAGEYCEVGDLLIAINDGPTSGSSVINTDWGKVEHNIDGAVFRGSGASNSSVGSSTQPVYVNGSGIVTAITGAIANDTTGNAATATVASKLSNTSAIGSSTQPVYFNSSGQPVAVNTYDKQTGKTTDFVPRVGSDGMMEIGKYIDFHNTSEDTSNYIVRITARDSSETDGAGLTLTGTTVGTLFKGNLNGTATKATQDGNGNVITSTYLKLSGGTMTGRLTLRPPEGEGGEIILAASAVEEQTQAGIAIDQYNSKFRIFGSNSKDGISKINSTPLVIDPYEKTITGGYTIFANIINNSNGEVSFVQNDIVVKNNTDWNTLVTPGCYKVQNGTWGDSTIYHGPNGADSNLYAYGLLFVFKGISSDGEKRIEQIYFPHQTTQGIYRRMHNGQDLTTGWQNWYSSTHKVKQATAAASNWRKILLNGGLDNGYNTWNDAIVENTDRVYQSRYIAVQPSSGTLAANNFIVNNLEAAQAVSTDANKKLVSTNLTSTEPTTSDPGITYIATISQNAVGKISATKSTVRSASTTQRGITKLNSATNSTSTAEAATPSAVKSAYDLANNHKYWANIEATSTVQYDKEPVVKTVTIGNGSGATAPTKKAQLVYDASLEVLNFVFS